jgi:hypothetical protein
MMWKNVLSSAALMAMLCGCHKEEVIEDPPVGPATANTEVLDSVALDAAPRLTVEPIFSIGSEGSEATSFSRIMGIEYRDSMIFVADAHNPSVRVFNEAGALVHTIGRRGAGPGEFEQPRNLVFWNDTLYVMDLRAVNRFASDLSYVSRANYQLSFTKAGIGSYSLVPNTFDFSADGLVGSARFTPHMGRTDVPTSDTTSLFVLSPVDGAMGKVLQRIVGNPSYSFGANGYGHALFAPETNFAVMRDSRILVANRNGVDLDVFRDTVKLATIRFAATRRESTKGDVDRIVALRRRGLEAIARDPNYSVEKDYARKQSEATRELPRFRHLPAVGVIVTSDSGAFLVQRPDLSQGVTEFQESHGETSWNVFSKDLKLTGFVEFPADFYPKIMRGDVVVGYTTDDDDIPTLRGYRIRTKQR